MATKRRFRIDLISIIGIIILLPLFFLAALRITHHDYDSRMVSAESVFQYLFLVAYVTLLIAAAGRHMTLGILSTLLIICHLTWTLPELLNQQPLTKAENNAQVVRIFSHNLKFDNPNPLELPADVKKADADVVFLEELTYSNEGIIEDSGALDAYPYKYVAPNGAKGLGIWSKTPLRDARVVASPGFPSLRAETTIQNRDVVLYAIHTRSPVNGDVKYWHDDFAQMKDEFSKETLPVIAAGDYNATWQHRPFRELLSAGYHDSAPADGRGYARSWPADVLQGPHTGGLIRIDHILYNNQFKVRTSGEMTGGGSDHRAIYADFVFAQR